MSIIAIFRLMLLAFEESCQGVDAEAPVSQDPRANGVTVACLVLAPWQLGAP